MLVGITGLEFERYVGQVFHDNGNHGVAKASGDYGVDIILNGYVAVQVKKYSSPVGHKAVQEVVAGKAHYNCTEAWVVTSNTFVPAAVALAASNGVRLIAGEELQWLADNLPRSSRISYCHGPDEQNPQPDPICRCGACLSIYPRSATSDGSRLNLDGDRSGICGLQ